MRYYTASSGKTGRARLAALVQDLAAEGAGVVGVERQTKNLEEIFLSLTNTQTGKEVG